MATTTDTPPTTDRRRRRRRTIWLAAGVAVLAVVGVGLALFQPWQLWIDTRVDDAAPTGAAVLAPSAASTAAPATSTAPATTTAPAPGTTVVATVPSTSAAPAGTSFVSLDHGTSGRVVLLQAPDGQRYVRFEELDTDNGPDLKVYLSTNPVDGPEQAFDDDIVNLGGLQGNLGNQNYALPADVDLARYRSVVIWCDRFNSAFGAAPLG